MCECIHENEIIYLNESIVLHLLPNNGVLDTTVSKHPIFIPLIPNVGTAPQKITRNLIPFPDNPNSSLRPTALKSPAWRNITQIDMSKIKQQASLPQISNISPISLTNILRPIAAKSKKSPSPGNHFTHHLVHRTISPPISRTPPTLHTYIHACTMRVHMPGAYTPSDGRKNVHHAYMHAHGVLEPFFPRARIRVQVGRISLFSSSNFMSSSFLRYMQAEAHRSPT